MPTFQPARKSFAPIRERNGLIACRWNTAVDKRFRSAVDLGNSYLHSSLDWVKTCLRIAPRFNRLCIQADSRSVRHIHFAEKVRGGLAIVHRRTTNKTKPS